MGRSPFGSSMSAAASFAAAVVVLIFSIADAAANSVNSYGVLSLKYRYAGQEMSLSAFKAHDIQRQQHILAGVDLPLGGTGRPDAVGLYYAKVGIGTPKRDYYVQVDTGSDLMWVNCIQCTECPKRSSLGTSRCTILMTRILEKWYPAITHSVQKSMEVHYQGAHPICPVHIWKYMEMEAPQQDTL